MNRPPQPPAAPAPLVSHSHYSLGYGVAAPEQLASRAAELGFRALALTDIETLAGQVRFHAACRAAGIRPVTGVELRGGYARRTNGDARDRLVLLAPGEQGYAKLCRIVSARRAGRQGGGKPTPAPLASLPQDLSGLLVLTDDNELAERLLGERPELRSSLRLLLGGSSPPALRERVAATSKATRVLTIAGSTLPIDAPGDLALQALVAAIRSGQALGAARPTPAASPAATSHRRTPPYTGDGGPSRDRSAPSFQADPSAVAEANALIESCDLDLSERPPVQPRLPELARGQAAAALRARCQGAGLASEAHRTRLERELGVIEALGYSDYFLAVAEIVTGARLLGIPTAGRGSAAGSLVASALAITDLDPLAHDLLFERFLNDRRSQPPDIDLDVASTGRDRLVAWVAERFGRERVAGIASYATFRGRSAVRHGLAALGVEPGRLAKLMRGFRPGSLSPTEEAGYVEEFLRGTSDPVARAAADTVARLVGLPSHASAHPAGIVIGDEPLDGIVPLERAPGGQVVTQYDHRSVERTGLLKIDLLGNHFLSELDDTLTAAGVKMPDDLADGGTIRTLDEADTIGCFQVESPAMRSVLRRMDVASFDDLIAALAIVRPGAAAGAAKDRFLRRARGEEAFDPLEVLGGNEGVPAARAYRALAERLARSHGVLLYDEDIMLLLATVGGVDLAEADRLRTAIIDAPDDSATRRRMALDFEAVAAAAGTPESVARLAWAAAERFASYSFARAHAASYAHLAWQAAWLRTNLPLEFGCAVINHHQGMYPARTVAAAIARWGVALRPPDVNESALATTVRESDGQRSLSLGLRTVKWLTKRTSTDLLAHRPFADLAALAAKARPSRRELTALVLAGACDRLEPLSPEVYPYTHQAALAALGVEPPTPLTAPGEGAEEARYRSLVRVRNEIAYLGMHVSDHPLRILRPDAAALGCLTTAQLIERARGASTPTPGHEAVAVAGLLAATRRVATESGEIRFVTIEDEAGLVEGVLPASATRTSGPLLTTPGPYLFRGRPRREGGDVTLVIDQVAPFHRRP